MTWKSPQTKYDVFHEKYQEMLDMRNDIVSSLIYLTHISNNKELNVNPLLSLTTNKVWKNIESLLHSSLYSIFESTFADEYLELQKPLLKLRISLLDYLLLCLNYSPAKDKMDKDQRCIQSKAYITQKIEQIQTKMNIKIDASDQNYVSQFLQHFASEGLLKILRSIQFSLRTFLVNFKVEKKLTLESELVIYYFC